ncbi:MAG: hypothetical protein K2N94_07760 [Lachnospiraceae bacterium]|nr:hypothetical protein [Lachnospiraceae bacterium]
MEEGDGGGRRGLSPIYQRQIRAWLEKKRMLGTGLLLRTPEYIPVCVRAGLRVCEPSARVEPRIREAVEEFFRLRFADFGAEFRYSELYGLLDGLSGTAAVESLTVTASGKGVRFYGDGSFRLPEDGLAVLEEVWLQLVQESRK